MTRRPPGLFGRITPTVLVRAVGCMGVLFYIPYGATFVLSPPLWYALAPFYVGCAWAGGVFE